MTKKLKFIDYYNEWAKTGIMPNYGLCNSLHQELVLGKEFELIQPSHEDLSKLISENKSTVFWANNVPRPVKESVYKDFNELRQNLVLLCACMRNEY